MGSKSVTFKAIFFEKRYKMLKNGCLFPVWINKLGYTSIYTSSSSTQNKKTLSQVLLLVQRFWVFLSNFILPNYRGLSF